MLNHGLNQCSTIVDLTQKNKYHSNCNRQLNIFFEIVWKCLPNRKWQDYVYIQCEYKSTKQKIKHLLREENKVKENKIS